MIISRLTAADYKTIPWRNGRGTTVEIFRAVATDGALLWRVSIADVVESGPFSVFAGVDRILALIEGTGFDLDFGVHGAVRPLDPFEPIRFSGDWQILAENVRGPSRDLNVMTVRDRMTADMHFHRSAFEATLAERVLCLALEGEWTLFTAGETWAIATTETLCVEAPAPRQGVKVEGVGVLAWITLHTLP